MDTSLLNCLLPKEILEVIFGFLVTRKDIRTCYSVCALWRAASSALMEKVGISVELMRREDVQDLLADISRYPDFKSKIKQLNVYLAELTLHEERIMKREDIEVEFGIIVNQCTNPATLKFRPSDRNYDCLKALACDKARLYRIQQIKVN